MKKRNVFCEEYLKLDTNKRNILCSNELFIAYHHQPKDNPARVRMSSKLSEWDFLPTGQRVFERNSP
jgi:hypothetical protein